MKPNPLHHYVVNYSYPDPKSGYGYSSTFRVVCRDLREAIVATEALGHEGLRIHAISNRGAVDQVVQPAQEDR